MSHPSPTPLILHLWGTYVPPWSPHGVEQLHADGQPEGTALAERLRAQTGLLWWHGQLSPGASDAATWGILSPLQQLWGLSPAQEDGGGHRHAEEPRFTWQQGALVLSGAATASCHHQWVTHAARWGDPGDNGCQQWVLLAGLPGGRRQPQAQALASFYSTPRFQKYLEMHTNTAVRGLL